MKIFPSSIIFLSTFYQINVFHSSIMHKPLLVLDICFLFALVHNMREYFLFIGCIYFWRVNLIYILHLFAIFIHFYISKPTWNTIGQHNMEYPHPISDMEFMTNSTKSSISSRKTNSMKWKRWYKSSPRRKVIKTRMQRNLLCVEWSQSWFMLKNIIIRFKRQIPA